MSITSDEMHSIENSVKKPASQRLLSPIEIGLLINKASTSSSMTEIAEQIGLKDKNFLKRFTKLLELPTKIQERVKWTQTPGSIAFTQAYEIVTSKNKLQIIEELNREENKNITRQGIRNLLRQTFA